MSASLIVSDGRDQLHRRPPALCGDYFQPNEMSFEQLLAQAAEYAHLMRFYQLDLQAEGDWYAYFSADETILMATILAVDTGKMLNRFELRLERQPVYAQWFAPDIARPVRASYLDQLDSPLLVVRALHVWLEAMRPLQGHAGKEVRMLLEGLLNGMEREVKELLEATPPDFIGPVRQVGVWARCASFYGSAGFGAFIIPEIDDEVVLGFFNNDPSCPVILGSLYSSKHVPPYPLEAANHIKALVTRSKLKMEFDDDKKVITLITPANNKVVISDDAKSILLQDQTGNKVELSPSGILLDSPKDITISAKGKVAISALKNVEVAAQMDVTVSGQNVNHSAKIGFAAKGTATAELSAAGQTTVKGAMVMIN